MGKAPCEDGASHRSLFKSAADLAAATSTRPTREDARAGIQTPERPMGLGQPLSASVP